MLIDAAGTCCPKARRELLEVVEGLWGRGDGSCPACAAAHAEELGGVAATDEVGERVRVAGDPLEADLNVVRRSNAPDALNDVDEMGQVLAAVKRGCEGDLAVCEEPDLRAAE